MKKYFIYLLISFFSYSCSFIAKKMYGVSQPKIETKESINKFINKYGGTDLNYFSIKPSNYFEVFKMISFSQGNIAQDSVHKFQISLPEILVFDRKGFNILFKKTDKECNAGVSQYLSELNKSLSYQVRGSLKLSKILNTIERVDSLVEMNALQQEDFTAILFWYKPIGKLYAQDIVVWENAALNNKKSRIRVLNVGMDILSEWPVTMRDSLAIKMGIL